jgi:hypothetical protein
MVAIFSIASVGKVWLKTGDREGQDVEIAVKVN